MFLHAFVEDIHSSLVERMIRQTIGDGREVIRNLVHHQFLRVSHSISNGLDCILVHPDVGDIIDKILGKAESG